MDVNMIREHYKDIIDVLSAPVYTYLGDEGLIYDEYPFEDYDWNTGASKVCILTGRYAFKTSFSGYAYDYNIDESDWYEDPVFEEWDKDYCATEYSVYELACAAGLGNFFCETVKLNDKVYVQEECDLIFDNCIEEDYLELDRTPFNDFTSTLDRLGLYSLRVKLGFRVMRFFVYQHSIDELIKLQQFLIDYDINDLHEHNLGWFGDKLKFFDFCGYNSSTSEKIKAA